MTGYRVDAGLCVSFATATLLSTGRAQAVEPCDPFVSYFLYRYQGESLKQHEWWVFDPSRQTDRLFLTMPDEVGTSRFDGVRWDTTYRTAFFNSGDSLYRVEWKFGAKPRLIGRLPHVRDPQGWWFNPDSSCWQFAAMHAIGSADTATFYWCEVWQSTKDVTSWRVIRSDTVGCEDGDCGYWPWYQEPWARRAPAVTLEDASQEASADLCARRASPFDTATVTVGGSDEDEWRFIPSQISPRHGVACRLMYSTDTVVSAPFFFVDLNSKTKVIISSLGEEKGWVTSLLSEHCGLLLLPGAGGPTLIDGATGKVLFSQAWNSDGAVWVPPPTRAP